MYLIPLSWKDLINYNRKTSYKNRPIIIVELDDEMNKKYNAVVIKYDNNKNIHIRYLDNPFYEEKYWWTGNKNNLCGLNPLTYSCKLIGDTNDDMDGLKETDFIEDGYDDIINYDKEPWRFYKTTEEYPYLNGIQGNINVNNYYINEFNKCLLDGKIPKCIKNKIKNGENIRRIKGSENIKNNDYILYSIIEGCDKNYLPIIDEYENYKNSNKIKGIMDNFKKIIGLMMTRYLIKNKMNNIGLSEDEILNIKNLLKDGKCNKNIIYIIPYIFDCKIKIFDCNNNSLNIIEYGDNEQKYIYLLKYMNTYDTLTF